MNNCDNCSRNNCQYINAEQILRLELKQLCPFWLPIKESKFVEEVHRKLNNNKINN